MRAPLRRRRSEPESDRGDEGEQFKGDELKAAGAQLLGRVTYEGFAKAWPTIEGTGWFGEKMNSMPKFVVSTTLSDADASWTNSKVIRDDVAPGEQAAFCIHALGAADELVSEAAVRRLVSLTMAGLQRPQP